MKVIDCVDLKLLDAEEALREMRICLEKALKSLGELKKEVGDGRDTLVR